jgi:hypothetical protein
VGDILWVIQDKTDALAVEAERRAHAAAMEEANARLTMSLQLAEIRAKEIVLLTELSGVLQSCQTRDEIFAAVQTYAGFLFTDEAGAIYYLNETPSGAAPLGASCRSMQTRSRSTTAGHWRGTTFPISKASQTASPCRWAWP